MEKEIEDKMDAHLFGLMEDAFIKAEISPPTDIPIKTKVTIYFTTIQEYEEFAKWFKEIIDYAFLRGQTRQLNQGRSP